MKNRPLILNILSIFFFSIALSIPIQIMFLYGHQFSDYKLILNKITYLNWLVIFSCLINSIALFTCHQIAKNTFALSLLTIVANNIFVGILEYDYSYTQTLGATILVFIISSFLIFSKAWDAILNPHLCWWRVAPREYKILPITLMWNKNSGLSARTHNISRSGAFVSIANDTSFEIYPKIIDISMKLGNNELNCQAEIVRTEKNKKGEYPPGLGIHFLNLNILNKIKLYSYLKISSLVAL